MTNDASAAMDPAAPRRARPQHLIARQLRFPWFDIAVGCNADQAVNQVMLMLGPVAAIVCALAALHNVLDGNTTITVVLCVGAAMTIGSTEISRVGHPTAAVMTFSSVVLAMLTILMMLNPEGIHAVAAMALPGVLVVTSLLLTRWHFALFAAMTIASPLIVAGFPGWTGIHLPRVLPARPSEIVDTTMILMAITAASRMIATLFLHAHAEVVKKASRDDVTGLFNRFGFLQETGDLIRNLKPAQRTCAVMFIQLRRFTAVNGYYGHAFGDLVLKVVAGRIVDRVPSRALLSRYGDHQFGLALSDMTAASASGLGRHLIDSISRPMIIGGEPIQLTVSAGIAIGPEHAANAEDLIRYADLALLQSDHSNSTPCQVFTPEAAARSSARYQLERLIRGSLDNAAFEVVYQPIFEVSGGNVCGFEALLRFRDEKGNLSLPPGLISVAEETGLINQIGLRVLELVCVQLGRWRTTQHRTLPVSVNISPQQLHDPDFRIKMLDLMRYHGVTAGDLWLEITETDLMHLSGPSAAQLRALRDAGFRIAIDDFGTGYSSLSALRNIPATSIKIDKSFLADVSVSSDARRLFRHAVNLAKEFGFIVVAEGVETLEQEEFARACGCDLLQGFKLGAPLEADAIEMR